MPAVKDNPTSIARPDDAVGDFLTWTSLGQDFARTAAALRCTLEDVQERATRNGWLQRVGTIKGSPTEQRQLNRAIVFVTAARLRQILDDEVASIAKDPAKLVDVTTEYTPKGVAVRSYKNLKLLAEALNECNTMTRGALGDGVETVREDEARLEKAAGAAVSVDVKRVLDGFESRPGVSAAAMLGDMRAAEAPTQ